MLLKIISLKTNVQKSREINQISDIFEFIETRVGYITTDEGTKGSGFFITPNLFVTCLHNVTKIIPPVYEQPTSLFQDESKTLIENEKEMRLPIQIKTTNGNIINATPHLVNKFHDLAIYECNSENSDYIDIPFNTPKVGDEVYIGGFPLSREEFTFHKGMVSSRLSTSDRMTIDASVLPGHSGSPIFFVDSSSKTLCFAGFVNAEVAEIDSHFKLLNEKIKTLKNRYDGISAWNDTTGIMTNDTGILDDIQSLYSTLRNNISTGLGVVIHIDPRSATPSEVPSLDDNFLVPKKERIPGVLSRDKEYFDWYHHMKTNKKHQLGELLGRTIGGGKDNISSKEAENLYPKFLKLKAAQKEKKQAVTPESSDTNSDYELTIDDQLDEIDRKLTELEEGKITKSSAKKNLIENLNLELSDLNAVERDPRIPKYSQRLGKFLNS
jgi:V8-like Glu-specific endopeptidase